MATGYLGTTAQQTGRSWNRFWFTPTDPAPLGLMRFLTGALLLYTLLAYAPDDLRWLLGADGLMPMQISRQLEQELLPDGTIVPRFRPTYLDQIDPAWMGTVHLIGLGIVGMFTLGIASRLTGWLSVAVAFSYFNRCPQATTELPMVISVLLVYLLLAPTGATFSLDALWRSWRGRSPTIRPSWLGNLSTRLLQLHLATIYFLMGVEKLTHPLWLGFGGSTALWVLIARAETQLLELRWVDPYPGPIAAMSLATAWFQVGFPLLVWSRLLRPLVLAFAVPMWLLLGLASGQMAFAACFLIGLLAWVPGGALRSAFGQSSPGSTSRRGPLGRLFDRLCPPLQAPSSQTVSHPLHSPMPQKGEPSESSVPAASSGANHQQTPVGVGS